MNRVEHLLRQKIGLDAASIGPSSVERTVRLRMKSLGVKHDEDYLRLLETSQEEWDELVESVVVTETWFFRDREPFASFVEMVRHDWLPQHPASALRVLSVPCSSGEEPYSLAMALLDANIPLDRFTIDGVDLSARALARAQRAIYGRNSFRGKDLDFRERFFHPTGDGHALESHVRDCVGFERANVFDDDFLAQRPSYDFIFCRNLLIYFDAAMQAKALKKLAELLTPQGVLFVGPAEMPLVTGHGFVSVNIPMTFACRKASDSVGSLSIQSAHSMRAQKSFARPPRPMAKRLLTENRPQSGNSARVTQVFSGSGMSNRACEPVSESTLPVSMEAKPGQPSVNDLMEARQLADAGKLTEAAAICQSHLHRQGPSAQAFYLLGLVHDADPDPSRSRQALDYYRKALYLEPNHYETLLQMSLLLEKSGDKTGARTFKRRAERVQQKR